MAKGRSKVQSLTHLSITIPFGAFGCLTRCTSKKYFSPLSFSSSTASGMGSPPSSMIAPPPLTLTPPNGGALATIAVTLFGGDIDLLPPPVDIFLSLPDRETPVITNWSLGVETLTPAAFFASPLEPLLATPLPPALLDCRWIGEGVRGAFFALGFFSSGSTLRRFIRIDLPSFALRGLFLATGCSSSSSSSSSSLSSSSLSSLSLCEELQAQSESESESESESRDKVKAV